ncbi:YciI family protein [Verticiella sediminum]|nr:YciI family protein [Verticiella sediminum]
MLFAVRFYDIPNGLAIRNAHMDAHMQWLEQNAAAIVAAGPLRTGAADSTPVGALWLIRADSFEAAQAMIQGDPFMQNGLREKVELYHWGKAYPQAPVEI